MAWRVDALSGLRLPPGVVERPDGTLETVDVRVRARRGVSVHACLELAVKIMGDARLSSGRQLAALAGALPGMRLTVAPDQVTDLLMEVRGGGYFARRILYRGDGDLKVLLNARLDAKPPQQGLGTASQTVEAAAAVRLGVDRLEAIAASLDGDVGWLVLPRWGYDAQLEQQLVDELPEHLWPEAERYLTGLGTADPVLRALLLAPLEDEKLSPEEQAALAEARARRGSGECHYTASEELRREIGW